MNFFLDKSLGDTASDVISDSSGVGTSQSDTTNSLSIPGTTVVCVESYNSGILGHLNINQGDILEGIWHRLLYLLSVVISPHSVLHISCSLIRPIKKGKTSDRWFLFFSFEVTRDQNSYNSIQKTRNALVASIVARLFLGQWQGRPIAAFSRVFFADRAPAFSQPTACRRSGFAIPTSHWALSPRGMAATQGCWAVGNRSTSISLPLPDWRNRENPYILPYILPFYLIFFFFRIIQLSRFSQSHVRASHSGAASFEEGFRIRVTGRQGDLAFDGVDAIGQIPCLAVPGRRRSRRSGGSGRSSKRRLPYPSKLPLYIHIYLYIYLYIFLSLLCV